MNITVDTQFSPSGVNNIDPSTITYRPATGAQSTGNVQAGGYTVDIADRVMDNEAYAGQGTVMEKIMQQASNTDAHVQKDFMIVMSHCVSGEDFQKMQEEGFRPGSTDVETYVNIVDQIKIKLAQAGVEVAGYNDDLDAEKIEQVTGDRASANALAKELSQALQESDMPVTEETITELVKAVYEGTKLEAPSEDAIKYLIVNQKPPTIDNIYKAQYSSTENIQQSQGYYSEGAGSFGRYYAKKADAMNLENLKGQMEAVAEQAGLVENEAEKAQAVEYAKWLVGAGIELNAGNLAMVSALKNLPLPFKEQDLAKLCVTAMENGKAPGNADLTGEVSITQQAQELVEEVAQISDEALHETVMSGSALNIKNLVSAQKQIEEQQTQTTAAAQTRLQNQQEIVSGAEDSALREAEAKRQLEEIRLMMTEEANRHLLKAGISIDTTELSKLVDVLRAAEQSIRAALFKGDSVKENDVRALLYEETLTKTREIAGMPAAVLGKMLSGGQSYTLLRIHQEGKELQHQNEEQHSEQNPNHGQQKQAASAYETLMTAPRKDLGDKISKAFRNVDDILTDMNMETSDANRRSVRILGYNRMEITQEAINAVKEADSQVQNVIGKMTPAAVLQMIREQKNPLEMTMQELEEYLDRREANPLEDSEKYSRFLQKLDRSNAIDSAQREAYIGIYRLFRQIEKSDGAVIGSIVSTGAQMNFKNMLSAVRTAADKNMDFRLDDSFGMLEDLITKGRAIDAQINTGYQGQADREYQNSDAQKQQKYYARVSGEINDELARRTDLEALADMDISENTTIEQFADDIKRVQLSEENIFLQKEQEQDYKLFQQNIQEAEKIDEQVIQSLIEYGQTISLDNIQAASQMILERGTLFRQVIGSGKSVQDSLDTPEEDTDTANAVLEQADHFVDNLHDAGQAAVSYQELIEEANKTVERMIYTDAGSHIDVRAAQALYKGLSLAGNLAREENYEVPMNIKGEITSVNLKIYHNASQTGKVCVTLETEKLGKVAAEFDVRADRISGMVVYGSRQEKAALEELNHTFGEALSAAGAKQVSVSLVHVNTVDLNKFGQDRAVHNEEEKLQTAELYQTAKAFLTALRELD